MKRNEHAAVTAALVAFLGAAVDLILWSRTGLTAALAAGLMAVPATLVSLLVLWRERLRREVAERTREVAAAAAEPRSASMFPGEEEDVPPPAEYTRRLFERFVVPAAPPVLALLQGGLAWILYDRLRVPGIAAAGHLLAGALLSGQAFVAFLASRFLLGLARSDSGRPLRGPGLHCGLLSLASLLGAAAALLAWKTYPPADRLAGWLAAALLAGLALESLAQTVADLYRPRGPAAGRGPGESRLAGLIADPAAWARNIAQAVDYQFGFKVSETWFYRFLETALLPLIVFQALTLYLLSCVAFIQPWEEGIRERLGRPPAAGWHLQGGVHFKLPWPFETVRRYPTRRIGVIHLGYQPHAPEAGPAGEPHDAVLLWTVPHHHSEENFVFATRAGAAAVETQTDARAVPVSLLMVGIPVLYTVTNVHQFAYNYENPAKVLENVACRVLSLTASERDIFAVMGPGQQAFADAYHDALQREVSRLRLGVRVAHCGVAGIHPPVPVAAAFETVVGAMEEREAAVYGARADARGIVPRAEARSHAILAGAEAARTRRREVSAAEADRFARQLEAFRASPAVYKTRRYLRSLQTALRDARKFIVAGRPPREVLILDLQEKPRLELFEIESKPVAGGGPSP